MTASALDRLRTRRAAVGSPLCLGIDPHPQALPDGLHRDVVGIERFARGLLEVAGEHAAAVKINVAFFEAFGSAGWNAIERLREDVPVDLPCILDAKRGDIGPTAERYAEALLGRLRADGVTLSPYLGEDAIEPFVEHGDALVYVLARTSNPSAARIQELLVDGEPLYRRVADWVVERWSDGRVGLVVGATIPGELAALRATCPGPAFLVPGVGAQGGDAVAAARAADGALAPGLVNVSRGIALASSGEDWREAAAAAASVHAGLLREAVLHSEASPATAGDIGGL